MNGVHVEDVCKAARDLVAMGNVMALVMELDAAATANAEAHVEIDSEMKVGIDKRNKRRMKKR